MLLLTHCQCNCMAANLTTRFLHCLVLDLVVCIRLCCASMHCTLVQGAATNGLFDFDTCMLTVLEKQSTPDCCCAGTEKMDYSKSGAVFAKLQSQREAAAAGIKPHQKTSKPAKASYLKL